MDYFSQEVPSPDTTECFSRIGDIELLADVYLADESKRNGAAIILIHGGGWSGGKRADFLWHAHRLSLRGYMACTIDYRLIKDALFPAAMEDCQAAVKWIRSEAARFGIKENRIGAFGSSAGGHLAACLGVLDDSGPNNISSKVNCVVDIHGVHDFVVLAGEPLSDTLEKFIGGTFAEKPELWKKASPALHVNNNSAPMLIVHDPHDELVPYNQSIRLANALIKAERPMQFLPTHGSGHGFVYDSQDRWEQQVWPIALDWLDSHLVGHVAKGIPCAGKSE